MRMRTKTIQARAIYAASVFRKQGISQAQIAEFVGASQGQVSRLLGGKISRASRLFEEICLLAERLEGGVSRELVIANDELLSALAETWDGTVEHSKALAIVIRSLAALKLVR
jgi:predicted XRE-type DNA-binding protein